MNLVLLSGGSGKRLWPLSNDSRSKQFLKILESETGETVSMIQRVYNQLKEANLIDSTIIATSKSQLDMINSQLDSSIPIVIEPERRDTFPAIALSAVYLYSVKNVDLNENIVVSPVDPYVDNDFFIEMKKLDSILNNSGKNLVLMGVKPEFPSTKYGYIIPDTHYNLSNPCLTVKNFKEKPDEEAAIKLIEQGALWNCGVFSFKLKFIIDIVKDLGLPIDYSSLLNSYGLLPKNSFDYEVVEKANNIGVVPYDGSWKDLGTWNTLTEEMEKKVIGKGKVSSDSENTHLINELDIPIAVLGVSDVLVAASPDGILVTEKSASPRLKEIITDFDKWPRFEMRRWGWYKVLDYSKINDEIEVMTKRIGILPGENLSYHYHNKRSESWTVLIGHGELVMNGELKSINAGDVIQISPGSSHAIKAISELEIIEVQRGIELIEEDIIRLELRWSDILDNHLVQKS